MSTLNNFKCVAGGLDVGRALASLKGSPLWDFITWRQAFPGSPHKDTRSIIVRGPTGLSLAELESPASLDYPYADGLSAVRDLANDIAARLPIKELGRLFVVSLRAGGRILPHADEGEYAAYYQRLHISLQSDEGNTFRCGDESIHMLPGTAWIFNHHLEHEVLNQSEKERVHIILDFKLKD